MAYSGPHHYNLFLIDNSKIARKEQNGLITNFSKPVTNSKQPKVYIIQSQGHIVYVGYASQSIGSRLAGGLRATGKNGHHGYGWKELEEVQLYVFVFEPFTQDSEWNKKHKLFVEAIEAELAYLVRQNDGAWPRYQSEIHFNNTRQQEVRAVAKTIFEEVSKHGRDEPGTSDDQQITSI